MVPVHALAAALGRQRPVEPSTSFNRTTTVTAEAGPAEHLPRALLSLHALEGKLQAVLGDAKDDETVERPELRNSGEPLTPTELARRWRASLCRSIMPAIKHREIKTIPWGKRERIPTEEVKRLEREGYVLARRRLRVRKPKAPQIAPDFDEQLARTRKLTYRDMLALAASNNEKTCG